MGKLAGIAPSAVWKYFEEICSIPHISHHEKALSDYCVQFAKDRGYYWEQDELFNVIIIAEATEGYEDVEPIIIQGHLDMVGDKIPECPINMETEPIQIKIDGDYVCAEGTTLGGDDGIAVAYALALLDAKNIPHPRLEVVLTVCEEVGLLGANGIDLSVCKAKRLLNIDSDVEGVLTAGCAGGVRVTCELPVEKIQGKGIVYDITIDGLKGGHSGIEINKGRANADLLMGRFLQLLRTKMSYGLVNIYGGAKENVIPKEAMAKIVIAVEDTDSLLDTANTFLHMMNAEYGTADSEIALKLVVSAEEEADIVSEESLKKILTLLNVIPNSVQSMSMDLEGLVETSLNTGVMHLEDGKFVTHSSVRSSIESAKDQVVTKITLLAEALGGKVELQGNYPGWEYARESKFRELCVQIFKEQYEWEPKVEIIHAGLECGILASKIPGLECISIGPEMEDIHTPVERVHIASVGRVWEYVKSIVAAK